MNTMYPAKANSPVATLINSISPTDTSIKVSNIDNLPDAPNLATIGTDQYSETILYTGKTTDTLTGVTRGFQGTASSWGAGAQMSRVVTAYDHDTFIANINELKTKAIAMSIVFGN